MPRYSFALEPNGEKRLEVFWIGSYKDLTISFDGNTVGIIPNQRALYTGQEFNLSDGSTVKIQLVDKCIIATEIQLLYNGKPVPGSPSDPETSLKNAYIAVYFVAGLSLVFGIMVSLLTITGFLQQSSIIGLSVILYGLLFLVLGFFTQRKSAIALTLAIIIFILNGVWGLVFPAPLNNNTGAATGIIIVQIFFLIPTLRGLKAIKIIQSEKK